MSTLSVLTVAVLSQYADDKRDVFGEPENDTAPEDAFSAPADDPGKDVYTVLFFALLGVLALGLAYVYYAYRKGPPRTSFDDEEYQVHAASDDEEGATPKMRRRTESRKRQGITITRSPGRRDSDKTERTALLFEHQPNTTLLDVGIQDGP
ncbi:hypothetical protein DIPPA_25826 [Diplonema papillatum]|nr:hypothetical protein DIPPA_25826 [Diplonema papillatum]